MARTITVQSNDEIAATTITDGVTHVRVEFPDGRREEIALAGVDLSIARTWGELVERLAEAKPKRKRRTRGSKTMARPKMSAPADSFEMAAPPPPPELSSMGLESMSAPAMSAPEAAPPPAEMVKTTLNAEFEGHDPGQPLQKDADYILAFSFGAALAHATTAEFIAPFTGDEKSVKHTIQLMSDDFEIQQSSLDLVLNRDGRSKGKARFDVKPLKEGPCTIEAMILREGNFVQKLTITTNVGGADTPTIAASDSVGRAVTADERVQPRNISIVITEEAGGLRVIAVKDGAIGGRLAMTTNDLAALTTRIRKELMEAVESFDENSASFIYQSEITIPDDVHEKTLAGLAKAGKFFFNRLFGAGADEGMRNIGEMLRTTLGGPPLNVQIVSARFFAPWPLLYIPGAAGDPPDPMRFLGMAHRVEEIALKTYAARPPEIVREGKLRIGVNVNTAIDEEMNATFIADQLTFFDAVQASGNAEITKRDSVKDVSAAITNAALPDQVMYFYCHAKSDDADPAESAFEFEGHTPLLLADIEAETTSKYEQAPLIFINACQSAKLSPLFYQGFVPFFTDHGARGVIGTECDTPALFAADWAKRFFREFLNGKELGDVVLELRRHYLEKENNLMGLLYAVHCNGNTRVDPALGLTAG